MRRGQSGAREHRAASAVASAAPGPCRSLEHVEIDLFGFLEMPRPAQRVSQAQPQARVERVELAPASAGSQLDPREIELLRGSGNRLEMLPGQTAPIERLRRMT